MRSKIRALLHGATSAQCDACVFSAFGCGAFGNPPEEVARLFKEELAKTRLRQVTFCILNDHNAGRPHNPKGNFHPFKEVFKDCRPMESETDSTAAQPERRRGLQIEHAEELEKAGKGERELPEMLATLLVPVKEAWILKLTDFEDPFAP